LEGNEKSPVGKGKVKWYGGIWLIGSTPHTKNRDQNGADKHQEEKKKKRGRKAPRRRGFKLPGGKKERPSSWKKSDQRLYRKLQEFRELKEKGQRKADSEKETPDSIVGCLNSSGKGLFGKQHCHRVRAGHEG